MNVSPDFHSSASRPEYSHKPSPPSVADRIRPRAPLRRASAPVGDAAVPGVITPDCCGSRRLSLRPEHAADNARTAVAATPERTKRREIVIGVSKSRLDLRVDTHRVVP